MCWVRSETPKSCGNKIWDFPGMRKTLLFVLTFSGLCAASTTTLRGYYYVTRALNWGDALIYCRDVFYDLSSIANADDNIRLSKIQDLGKLVWIGLYDDVTRWKWALGNADYDSYTDFDNWESDEPNNRWSEESCTAMTAQGFWYDIPCSYIRPAVCFYEKDLPTYIFVETDMTWNEARAYCVSNYTDLASVRTMSENNKISSLVKWDAWIGLHRKPWAWIDGSPINFTNWDKNHPSSSEDNECAAINTTTGKWRDADCEDNYYFICEDMSYSVGSASKVQSKARSRYKLKFQYEADLNNPAIHHQILEQLHAKLKKHGLPDLKLHWIPTDGQTFVKEQEMAEEQGSCD